MSCEVILGAVVGLLFFGFLWVLQPRVRVPSVQFNHNHTVRTIHQIWFQGAHQLPDKFVPYRESCVRVNAGWNHTLHDDAALRKACQEVDAHDPCLGLTVLYDNADTMHERIDMGRMAILWAHGGVSVDMDMMCTLGLDNIMSRVPPSNVGLSVLNIGPIGSTLFSIQRGLWGQPALPVNNAVWVVPKPHNPALLNIIRQMAHSASAVYTRHPSMDKTDRVAQTWGPLALTKVVHLFPSNVTLFPPLLLEKNVSDKSLCDRHKTVLCHINELSWFTAVDGVRTVIMMYMNNPILFDAAILAGVGALVGLAVTT